MNHAQAHSASSFPAVGKGVKVKDHLKYEDISKYFHLPIHDAAAELELCTTLLKRVCRKNEIHRWPHRKIRSVNRKIAKLEKQKETALDPTQIAKAEEEIAILHSFRIGILTDPSYLSLEIPSNSASKKRFAERVESRRSVDSGSANKRRPGIGGSISREPSDESLDFYENLMSDTSSAPASPCQSDSSVDIGFGTLTLDGIFAEPFTPLGRTEHSFSALSLPSSPRKHDDDDAAEFSRPAFRTRTSVPNRFSSQRRKRISMGHTHSLPVSPVGSPLVSPIVSPLHSPRGHHANEGSFHQWKQGEVANWDRTTLVGQNQPRPQQLDFGFISNEREMNGSPLAPQQTPQFQAYLQQQQQRQSREDGSRLWATASGPPAGRSSSSDSWDRPQHASHQSVHFSAIAPHDVVANKGPGSNTFQHQSSDMWKTTTMPKAHSHGMLHFSAPTLPNSLSSPGVSTSGPLSLNSPISNDSSPSSQTMMTHVGMDTSGDTMNDAGPDPHLALELEKMMNETSWDDVQNAVENARKQRPFGSNFKQVEAQSSLFSPSNSTFPDICSGGATDEPYLFGGVPFSASLGQAEVPSAASSASSSLHNSPLTLSPIHPDVNAPLYRS